ncbi:unnamed protein product [Ambrosiozyma monospora]|uniref:Unnamed protein product n=1 Tax=Ambrosiozyma monospora TaxID=43982 RepID=A0A9W6T7Q4_AMBMO|nr:unnamed protein product [Ambrosiozyma monospora]
MNMDMRPLSERIQPGCRHIKRLDPRTLTETMRDDRSRSFAYLEDDYLMKKGINWWKTAPRYPPVRVPVRSRFRKHPCTISRPDNHSFRSEATKTN